MKKIPTWIVVILVVGLLVLSKFLFFPKKNNKPGGQAKGKNAMPVAVNYFLAKSAELQNDVFATGQIGALNQVELLPEVSGKVTAIYFREGEKVSKGDVLVKLNDADLQAQLLKIKTQLKLSEQKLDRLKKLLAINGISQEEFDMQENEVMALKADEAFTFAQISKTTITAPFPGFVGLKNISEGSYVNATTPIVSLVQMKPVYVEFSVPEKYNSMFRKGLDVRFSVDNPESKATFTASIYAIEPRVDESTKTIRARAMYNGDHMFYPGSFVRVLINLGTTRNTVMVPSEAVIPTLKGQNVFIAKGGLAVEQPVKIGVRTEDKIQILEGVKEGDTIVTTGLLSVKQGSAIKLIKAAD